MDDQTFQEYLRIIQSGTPPDGRNAALALQAAWHLLVKTKNFLADAAAASWWMNDNATTLQNQMDEIASLAASVQDLPGPLQPELVYRVRASVAGAFVSARAAMEAIGAVLDAWSASSVVDYFRNWSTYAGEGAQAAGAGLERGLAWAIQTLLDSRLFQLGAIAAIALYLKGK